MAISKSWISHIEVFVDVSRSSIEQNASRDAIALLLKNDVLTLDDLVKEMGLYLTTTDYLIRGRGVLLLAELLTCLASKPLGNTTVHCLAEFFTGKMETDWQVLHGSLVGCLALLRRKRNLGSVTSSDISSLIRSYVENVQVQLLGKRDRKICFEILNCLLNDHPDIVSTLGDSFLYGICEAIDQEKDPHCLMLTFHIVADLARLFPDPFGPLAGLAEGFFDVLGSYFPIHFTHPSDDFDIKRDDLSEALMLAFGSTSLFEPFAVPLLLEKLSSSLPSAKVDSIKYLTYCSVKYGADIMAKHAKAIWSLLKDAIFSSLQDTITSRISESPDDMGFPNDEIAKEALLCVQKFMLQEDGLFLSLILEDEDVELILRSASSVISFDDISVENRQKIYALGCILWTSAKVSIPCCNKIFQHFFPRLMETLGLSNKQSTQACVSDDCSALSGELKIGAVYLCIELLVACRGLSVFSEELTSGSISSEATWCCFLKEFSGPLKEVFHSMLVTSETQDSREAYIYCGVKGLQILATFQRRFLPISIFEDILTIFTSILISDSGRTLLWKLTLKALVEIGTFIERFHDSEKALCYMTIVVEKVVSFICPGSSSLPVPLQLEAISCIGTSGSKFMLRVTQGLEAAISSNLENSIKGNLDSVETSVLLLECYSGKVLPWYKLCGGFEEVALRFTLSIWNQIEGYTTFNISQQGEKLLDRLMATVKLSVAGCSETNQVLMLQRAYSVLSSSPIETNQDALSSRDVWITYLFVSVVIPLHPKTPIQNVRAFLKLFTILTLKGHVPTAHGLGSLINKLPSNKSPITDGSVPCTLEEALDIVLNTGLNDLVQSNAIVGLAWIGKGLNMRGHERVKDVIMMILGCILSNSVVTRAAADAFHVLLSDTDICLNKTFHAITKPLHRQRFFSSMMPVLLTSLKDCDSPTTRCMLYRALGHVISNSPLSAVVNEAKSVIFVLLDAISVLSVEICDRELTYSLLLVLSGMIMDENAREAVTDNAPNIIKRLIGLTSYPHMMVVRETGIECLVAMSILPHTRIFPLRRQVLEALSKALDDPKRKVRQQAVRCRHAWSNL
ncbi:hypothetical protein ACHQM5_002023 [Ranunculus cassubicifolius]